MTTDQPARPPASTLEALRRFWLGFATNVPADTEDIGFVMEVTGCILEALKAEYDAQRYRGRLADAIQQDDEPLFISSLYSEIATHLLKAAELWGEDIANGIAGCTEKAVTGMDTTIRSLLHLCVSQRVRLTGQAFQAACKQVELHRQVLQEQGCQELLIV